MNFPDDYELIKLRDDNGFLDEDKWYLIENVTIETDELGLDDPSDDSEGWVLNRNNVNVGAVWTQLESNNENQMFFHIAIVPDERGLGLSSKLLEVMFSDFERRKSINPNLELKAFVVNPILKSSLNRKGYYVSHDSRTEHEPHAYEMRKAPSVNDLLKKALAENPTSFFNAFKAGADELDLDVNEWIVNLESHLNSSSPKDLITGAKETITKLPLNHFEIESLWGRFESSLGDFIIGDLQSPTHSPVKMVR